MIGYLKGGALAISGLIILWFYIYVNDMRNELDIRIEQQAKTEQVVKVLKQSIGSIKEDIEDAEARLSALQEERIKSKKKLDNLENILANHDIKKIRSKKPELLRRVYERGLNQYYGDVRNVMEN